MFDEPADDVIPAAGWNHPAAEPEVVAVPAVVPVQVEPEQPPGAAAHMVILNNDYVVRVAVASAEDTSGHVEHRSFGR